MELTGFAAIDLCAAATGMPGVGVLEYAAVDGVDTSAFVRALNAAYNQQLAVTFSTGEWLSLPFVAGSGAWSEEEVTDAQGNFFRVSVSCVLPGDSPAIRKELNNMRRHRFVLRITRNGQPILVGDPERPLRFESRYDSGAGGGDSRAHRCTFTGVVIEKSAGYSPVF